MIMGLFRGGGEVEAEHREAGGGDGGGEGAA